MSRKLFLILPLLLILGCALPALAAPTPVLAPLPLGELHMAMAAAGQVVTGHSTTLTWSAPADVVAGSTYDVLRANAVCPVSGLGTLTFTKVNASAIVGLTFTDGTIGVGNWCYYVTQSQNGATSLPSNTTGGQARPNTVTVQIVIN